MPSGAPRLAVYCRVWFGAGHWIRTAAIMAALTRRFRVTAVIDGALTPDLAVPAGVEPLFLPVKSHDPTDAAAVIRERVGALASVLDHLRPAALVLEYFPFGRIEVVQELTRWLMAAHRQSPRPLVICSLRDIQQRRRPNQAVFDRDAASLVNRYFDAVLVHADPSFIRFDETVANAAAIRVPIHHTGYVVGPADPPPAVNREPVIVVSAGGGRGGDHVLLAAVAAQRDTDLATSFSMRVIAGTLVADDTWRALQDQARRCERLEVMRWVPDLAAEMSRAAVSLSRCGYNTALDLVRSRVPALVVPYATPHEDEQTVRAARLARAGLARLLVEEAATPQRLAEEIRQTAGFTPAAATLDLNGAEQTTALLASMLASRESVCSS